MTRGVVGTRNLNTVLQQLINPPSPEKVEINRGGNLLREGDRIIQLTNDYNRESLMAIWELSKTLILKKWRLQSDGATSAL